METREISAVATLTLNPCFDLTLTLTDLNEDDVNRVTRELFESAGKGMNVSCVLSRFGVKTRAFILAGRDNAELYRKKLPSGDFEPRFITVPGRIRENMTICPPGRCLKINREGFVCTPEAVNLLLEDLGAHLRPGMLLAVSGSWPKGFETSDFMRISELVREKGARLALDTERTGPETLKTVRPWILKPNEHELSVLTGLPAGTPEETRRALSVLHACGVPHILLSLGGRGLILSAPGRRIAARVPDVEVQSAVGAGDSCLAGFLAAYLGGLPPEDCVRQAAASGTATAMLPGTGLVTPELCAQLLPRIQLEEMEPIFS